MDFEHKSGFARTLTDDELATIREHSADYVFAYGVRQSLADSYASAKTEAEADAAFSKRLRKLLEGSMDIREVSRSTDPVKSETRRLANADLDAWAKSTPTIRALTKEARKAWIAKLMADEGRIARAKENVEREKARLAEATMPDELAAMLGLVEAPTETPAPAETPAEPKKGGKRK